MEKRGLIYVVFGKEYDKLASHTIAYSRQFTNLPITVITNLKERCSKWREVEDINFIYIDIDDDDNRDVKTNLLQYSPYDITLYVDADAVIQKEGIEEFFDISNEIDVVLIKLTSTTIRRALDINNLYKKISLSWFKKYYLPVFKKNKIKEDDIVQIFYGGIFMFRKNIRVNSWFKDWNYIWNLTGKSRDMPPLSCSVFNCKKLNLCNFEIKDLNNYFLFHPGGSKEKRQSNFIIQHRYGKRDSKNSFYKCFNIPFYKQNKKFDK